MTAPRAVHEELRPVGLHRAPDEHRAYAGYDYSPSKPVDVRRPDGTILAAYTLNNYYNYEQPLRGDLPGFADLGWRPSTLRPAYVLRGWRAVAAHGVDDPEQFVTQWGGHRASTTRPILSSVRHPASTRRGRSSPVTNKD